MSASNMIQSFLEGIRSQFPKEYNIASSIFDNDHCTILSQSATLFELLVIVGKEEYVVKLEIGDETIIPKRDKEIGVWDKVSIAALLKLRNELQMIDPNQKMGDHKQYTRKGMIHRVLAERKEKALKEEYTIRWADNIYGDHIVYNNKGSKYKVFLRDFDNETGYSDSPDAGKNKLGTTKHIMSVFHQLKSDTNRFARLSHECPFVEIYLDPLNEDQITWFYSGDLHEDVAVLIIKYFGEAQFIPISRTKDFLPFLEEAGVYSNVKIRPEVGEKIDALYEEEMMGWIKEKFEISFDKIKANLYPYQKEGVSFVTYKKGVILADEMGLGKTLQSIAAAIAKKEIFSFRKTLIVCPASLKDQWKKEIEKFSDETAEVIQGTPHERHEQYRNAKSYFFITNYESVLRDSGVINKAGIDFLILDEAQKIKNFETKTWSAINRLEKKHILILTGTPIENRLIDLFSLMQTIDPEILGPLWEFSYKHCLFDTDRKDKINGYYDLQSIKKTLDSVLLRREKRKVLDQLPNISQQDVFVDLSPLQAEYHAGYASGISRIIRKKFLTPSDLTRLQMLLMSMRMVCNSTFLIDGETNSSTKLDELKEILIDKLELQTQDKKVIIFSEWIKSHKLIGEILRQNDIGFTELNGTVPVKKRGDLIKKFEDDSNCKVFLSTEAGGSGLNLQVADTLINFELPWNPAKKNQRIGRIDRLGQKSKQLTIINLISKDSIEMQIASGLMVKQNLFDGVLNKSSTTDEVDFSEKGRSQFLKQIEEMLLGLEVQEVPKMEAPVEEDWDDQLTLFENEKSNTDSEHSDVQNQGHPSSAEDEEHTVFAEEAVQMEEVMTQGLGFLSGLYKMATGTDLSPSDQKIEVNKETGEVTMKFKLPGFK